MTIFEIMDGVESKTLKLELARAVLTEVEEYFIYRIEPDSTEAYLLAKRAGHISNLLAAVDCILRPTQEDLNEFVSQLADKIREERVAYE